MRELIALVALGVLLAMPCPAPAADVEEEPNGEEQPIGVEPTEVQPGDVLEPAQQRAQKVRPTIGQPTEEKRREEPTEDELLDEHMDALRDYEQAETDEEAAEAQKRFEDASEREMKLRREKLIRVLER